MELPRPRGRFPVSARVRKRREFQLVQSTSRRVTTTRFVFLLHARQTEPEAPPRLGITASRRIGNAPTRNRAKRLVREAFRATRDLFRPGLDVVIIVRQLPRAFGLAQVVEEWRDAEARIAREAAQAFACRIESIEEQS